MVTPELQKYINEQRAAGISDEQIRQVLSSQGWGSLDLDQALGTAQGSTSSPSSNPSISSTKMPGWAKLLIVVVVVVFILPFLVWGIVAGVGYYKFTKNVVLNSQNLPSPNTISQTKIDPRSSCADNFYLNKNYFGALGSMNVKFLPADFPVYPGSKLGGSVYINMDNYQRGGPADKFLIVIYCTSDSVEKVEQFLLNAYSAWMFESLFDAEQHGEMFSFISMLGASIDGGANPLANSSILVGKRGKQEEAMVIIRNDGKETVITVFQGEIN